MQNFLTARYRQVHNKIKDVRLSSLRSKFPKSVKDIGMLSILDQMPSSPLAGKIPLKYPYMLGTKIAQFPYGHYWRKSWPFRYWTAGIIVCLPIFYQMHTLANPETTKRKFESSKPKTEGKAHNDGTSIGNR